MSENARLKYKPQRHAGRGCLGQESAQHAGEVHERGEDRERDDAGDHARDDEIAERVDGRGFERVDLLGDPHRAELGADAGADPAGQQQARRQRPRLAHERNRQAGRDHRFGAEALERRARMHRQHDADRHAGDRDQRRRSQSELIDLAHGFAKLERRDEDLARSLAREQCDFTDPARSSDGSLTEPMRALVAELCKARARFRVEAGLMTDSTVERL